MAMAKISTSLKASIACKPAGVTELKWPGLLTVPPVLPVLSSVGWSRIMSMSLKVLDWKENTPDMGAGGLPSKTPAPPGAGQRITTKGCGEHNSSTGREQRPRGGRLSTRRRKVRKSVSPGQVSGMKQ
jgi:hypothetical protein